MASVGNTRVFSLTAKSVCLSNLHSKSSNTPHQQLTMRHSQAGKSEMHACFTPPPSSIGQLSPTRQDEDFESSHHLWPDSSIQTSTMTRASDHDSSFRGRRHYRRDIPMRLRTSSKHFRSRRPSSPSSDSDVTNDSSEDELLALPGLPPSKNLSYYVQRAKGQFKPYDRQGHGPNAIELRFFHKSVGKYSSETDMTLTDVQAVS